MDEALNLQRKLVDTGKLNVAFRKGQMVLELPSGVLFPSGKHKLKKQAKEGLAEIAQIFSEGVRIEGYASYFGERDNGGDVVVQGAYAKSLARLSADNRQVKMLWQSCAP